MSGFDFVPVIDEGLGNATYLLGVGDGRAVVIDPERDLRAVRAEAARRGLSIGWAVETHLHADFISGVRELADVEDATVIAPEVGERGFATTALADGDTIRVGALTLQALHTPGHSPEHLSYLLMDDNRLAGVFTGGSLMVGTAGRTDLVSPDQTVPLARAQYRSLQRLIELPDDTPVWPTHGAGSFCSAATGTERVTTIGKERVTNPLLQVEGEDAFVDALLASLGTFPDYFLRLGDVNRAGPAVLGHTPSLTPLRVETVQGLLDDGAQIVDVRPAAAFAAGHVPGSLSITLRSVFSTWLGWLVEPNLPVVVVRDEDQNVEDIVWGAANVGFDRLAGELTGGIDAWSRQHRIDLLPFIVPEHATDEAAAVLDVRQEAEFVSGHVRGARNIELGAVHDRAEQVHGPVLVMCGHGERAMTAASVLQRASRSDVHVFEGGPGDWQEATSQPLETGR